jgi:protein TonB
MPASHAHPSRLELSGIRIAGTSAAIALHAAVLMMLFTPTQWQPPIPVPTVEPPISAVEIVPAEHIKILPLKPHVVDHPKPAVNTPAKSAPTDVVAVTDDASTEVATAEDNTEVTVVPSFQPTLTAELSADVAPAPPYPPMALREGITGQVLLRISVDNQGRPIDGRIEKSSGSRLLDQTALKYVLAHWHFNAAIQGGTATGAVALVPIVFTLDR